MKGNAFLDTNVAMWWAEGNSRLGARILDSIMKHPRVYVSSVSIAELRVKALKRKIQLPPNLVEIFTSTGMEVDSFSVDAANQISRFEALVRHDPFDRMILAQAASHRNATFYTADDTLASLGLDWVVHVAK